MLSHLAWIILFAASFAGVRFWLAEHDARLQAESDIKASQLQIITLQQGITARDKAASIQVAPIVKIIHDVQTVPQAVAALPQIVNTPLPMPVTVQPNNSISIPEPDVMPIFTQMADDKICRVQLATATQDVIDNKAIIAQQTTQITTLKKKPKFWKRVTSVVKDVAIGVGIGVVIGAKL